MFGKDKKEEFHEKILYEAQPNIFVYSKGILISMFVLGFLFFLYSAGVSFIGNMNVYLIESTKVPLTRYFAIAVFIAIMVVFAYIIIKLLIWTSIKYTITESRVIVEQGIILQKRNYMPFNTIQDVSRSQSLLGKIFSVGTITLYSAYDGKDLELKDVSSPKKIEDIIFENIRGTHLRYQNIYDESNNSGFHPIRPNSDEHEHYRRMEDLDDLELVDAKERKRQLREIRRKAKNSRANPNYNSNYNSNYNDSYRSNGYYDDYDDYGGYDDDYADYPRDMGYRDNRAPRDSYAPRQYGSRRRPDSHHHQNSGAIKESYSRNPDKYFANNYEEFHQNNLDAQRDYDDYVHGRNQYAEDYDPEPPKAEKKSKGLSRFNPFSSNKNEDDDYENISDEEFDTTINQAMQDMGDNIKFKPSNDNRYRDNPNNGHDYNFNHSYQNSRRYNNDRRHDNYDNRHYDDYYEGYPDSRHRDNPNRYNDYREDSNRYDDRRDNYSQRDYRQNENYGQQNRRNSNYGSKSQHYDNNPSRDSNARGHSKDSYGAGNQSRHYSDNGEIDYKYKSPRESRKRRGHNSNRSDNHGQHNADMNSAHDGNENGNKNPDDPFVKHSRKFRR